MPDRCVEEVKKTCSSTSGPSLVQTLSLEDVVGKLNAATAAGDWHGLLALEGRMEELLEAVPDNICEQVLRTFANAHSMIHGNADSTDHALSAARLLERRVNLLGKLDRFREQGELLCDLGDTLVSRGMQDNAAKQYELAFRMATTRGLFSVECRACYGLGWIRVKERRYEEGVEQLRNALACLPISGSISLHRELTDSRPELRVLNLFIKGLFAVNALDELETLVPRYREAAKAQSRGGGRSWSECDSLLATARLHEARGRPEEAGREVRVMLDLLRENRAAVHERAGFFYSVVREGTKHLMILDPELGEEELIQAVAAEVANLREMAGEAE